MKQIPNDIFLELGGSDLERASLVAMEFRGPLRNVWLLPSLCVAHGPEAVRALQPVGTFRVVADTRIRGDVQEVEAGVVSAVRLGFWGVTVSVEDPGAAAVAARALKSAVLKGQGTKTELIGTLEPFPSRDSLWSEKRKTFETYTHFVHAAVKECREAGFYGMRVRESEARLVKQAGLRAFVRAKSLPQRYTSAKGQNPTPTMLLDRGVHHPTVDPIRLQCQDLEMSAAILYNELRQRKEEAKNSLRYVPTYSTSLEEACV